MIFGIAQCFVGMVDKVCYIGSHFRIKGNPDANTNMDGVVLKREGLLNILDQLVGKSDGVIFVIDVISAMHTAEWGCWIITISTSGAWNTSAN